MVKRRSDKMMPEVSKLDKYYTVNIVFTGHTAPVRGGVAVLLEAFYSLYIQQACWVELGSGSRLQFLVFAIADTVQHSTVVAALNSLVRDGVEVAWVLKDSDGTENAASDHPINITAIC